MSGKIVHALEPVPEPPAKAIYLAGPVPRDPAEASWHDEAIEEIRRVGFRGYVIVPRLRPGNSADSPGQTKWEYDSMTRADALLFWIPRVLWELPGLTSNLEWGVWHDSGKAVLGAPPNAPRMGYLRFYAELAGAPQASSLGDAAQWAVKMTRCSGR